MTPDANHPHISRHPGPHKGAFRDRHGRRVGMRWTRAAPLTRALILRTAKSCGPDAPTLASSWRKKFHQRRWQSSPVTGESAEETVKTIAREMPGVSGVTVVTTLVCSFYFACEATGASSARHSLRPLISRDNVLPELGRIAPRECGVASACPGMTKVKGHDGKRKK